jgi:uncharacterized membrane protein
MHRQSLQALLLTAACGASCTPAVEPENVTAGHVTIGHEVHSFRACGADVDTWLVDQTGGELTEVVALLSAEPYQPVFAEVAGRWGDPPATGFGADFDASLSVTALIRAENEGHGCGLDTTTFDFDMRGNEPSWRVTIDGTTMKLVSMDGTAIATVGRMHETSNSVRILGTSDEGDIAADIQVGRCIDSMSGAHYALSATVTSGLRTMTGCAIAGRHWRSKLTPSDKPSTGS